MLLLLLWSGSLAVYAQDLEAPADTLLAQPADSLALANDSVPEKKAGLDAPVTYQATDSMVMTAGNWAYLYGEGDVKYQNIELQSELIEMNLDSSMVYAKFGLDSIGDEFGYPLFKEGEQQYESKTMRYNFKSKKGYITDVITQQGEGYVTAGRTKKMEGDVLNMVGGRYTTCDEHEHPHFYIQMTKAKVRPKKNIVTGPVYLVLEDVPLYPLGLPFCFFPFSSTYSSGIIMPTFGDESTRGFYLREGGYYFALSDYMDLAVLGEIYTKGSWGLSAKSQYKKRYKYSGNFNASYLVTKLGDKGLPDYSLSKDFKIQWTHTSISLTLPSLTVTMTKIFPFKRKKPIGKERWYEKIAMSYTGTFSNSITTKENQLLKSNLVKDWKNGAQHKIPVSATFQLFNYINITPQFDYTERWYTSKITQEYDPQQQRMVARDTTYNFYRVYDFSGSISASTTLYGFFKPLPFLGNKVEMIRHRFEPSVSFSAAPDFASSRFGFYEHYVYQDANGNDQEYIYSPFSHNMYGVPGQGKQGNVSFQLNNNLEMKVRSDKDSTGFKKISLIDKLSLGMSYNLAADSFQWSDLSASIRLKLSKSYTLNLSGMFDTYTYDENGQRLDIPRWKAGKGIGRLRSTSTSFSYTFNNDTFKKLFGKKDEGTSGTGASATGQEGTDPGVGPTDGEATGEEAVGSRLLGKKKDTGEYDSDGYLVGNIPWSLSFSYSLSLGYGTFNREKREYDYRLTNSLSFNGNIQPTKNWTFNFNATYDFDAKKISYMTCNISRNMHCWQMTASFVPVGPYKSYSFSVSVSSSLLKDLKYDKRSNYRDGQDWY